MGKRQEAFGRYSVPTVYVLGSRRKGVACAFFPWVPYPRGPGVGRLGAETRGLASSDRRGVQTAPGLGGDHQAIIPAAVGEDQTRPSFVSSGRMRTVSCCAPGAPLGMEATDSCRSVAADGEGECQFVVEPQSDTVWLESGRNTCGQRVRVSMGSVCNADVGPSVPERARPVGAGRTRGPSTAETQGEERSAGSADVDQLSQHWSDSGLGRRPHG